MRSAFANGGLGVLRSQPSDKTTQNPPQSAPTLPQTPQPQTQPELASQPEIFSGDPLAVAVETATANEETPQSSYISQKIDADLASMEHAISVAEQTPTSPVAPPMQPAPPTQPMSQPQPMPSQPQQMPPQQPQPTVAQSAPQPQPNPNTERLLQNLADPHPPVFDQVLPQAVNQYATQAENQLYQQQASAGFSKETIAGGGNAIEAGVSEAGDIQYVEQEPAPEMPVEVEGYLQHVQDQNPEELKEVILAEEQAGTLASKYPKQSVVVLPISPEEEKEGARKGVVSSFRWLVEWSRKIMKMFTGEVVYRAVDES